MRASRLQHRHFCAPPRSQPARAFTEAPHRAQRRHKQQCARAHRPQRFADGQHAMVKRSTARAIGAKSRGGATTALETGDGGRATRETYTYSYNLMSLVFTLLSLLLRLRHTVDTIVHRPRTMLPRSTKGYCKRVRAGEYFGRLALCRSREFSCCLSASTDRALLPRHSR